MIQFIRHLELVDLLVHRCLQRLVHFAQVVTAARLAALQEGAQLEKPQLPIEETEFDVCRCRVPLIVRDRRETIRKLLGEPDQPLDLVRLQYRLVATHRQLVDATARGGIAPPGGRSHRQHLNSTVARIDSKRLTGLTIHCATHTLVDGY
ncbi:MAG: hypothetical protein WBM81_06510 [Sedimenticolaceae bacterium]